MSGSGVNPEALLEWLSDFLHRPRGIARRRRSRLQKLQRAQASQASAIFGAASSRLPFIRTGRERWRSVDRDQRKSRRSLRLMCRKLSGPTIQLHDLGLRSERIRSNGSQASRTHTDASPLRRLSLATLRHHRAAQLRHDLQRACLSSSSISSSMIAALQTGPC
jgi:hypothetical protein